MARAQAQYLRLFSGTVTYDRWQNYYSNALVLWNLQWWPWLPFDADGFTDGALGDEGGMDITLPATPQIIAELQQARRDGWLAELLVYEFDDLDGTDFPQPAQILIASTVGEVVGVSGSLSSLTMEIGSSLAPVGAQVPPRTYTTRLVGAPCRL